MKTLILILLTACCLRFALSGSCHFSCGSQSAIGCKDFAAGTNLANQCYTCAFGYMGGGGNGVNTGTCTAGTCNEACKSCLDTTASNCYICTGGYYDPTNNPAKASSCIKCHDSCWTCVGTSASSCLTCALGWFDDLENPYTSSACTKCADQCKTCRKAADRCLACSQAGFYSSDELLGGTCLPIPEAGAKMIFAISILLTLLVFLL